MSADPKKKVRLVHFSDLHLPLPRPVRPWQLVGKRVLGWANLRFNRGKTYGLGGFHALLQEVAREEPDLYVLTGDSTSLAFDFEFAEVDRLLRGAGVEPERTVIVPGNHDRYAVSADVGSTFERSMAPWLPDGFAAERGYPYARECGPVTVIAVDTAVWRNPVRAAGYVSPRQIERLVALVDGARDDGRWPVIAMHHPPFHLARARLRDYRTGLDGVDSLIGALGDRSATVLHGHLHRFARRAIGNLEVIGVPSASNDSRDELTQLGYHVYTFGPEGLEGAEGVRLWPSREERLERFELPGERLAD